MGKYVLLIGIPPIIVTSPDCTMVPTRNRIARARIFVYGRSIFLLELRRFGWQIKETQGLLLEVSWTEMIYC